VHYWATWCATCVAEIHKFDTLAPRLKKEDIEFLLIAVNDSRDSLLEFQQLGRTHLPFFVDVKDAHQTELGLRGLPVTVLLTRTGDIIPFEDPEYHNRVTKLRGSRKWLMPGVEQIFARAVEGYEAGLVW
jgi:hypothetical protein